MALAELLQAEDIIELSPDSKWTLIDQLIQFLFARNKIEASHQQEITRLIREREESMSTGIGDGVAIPHCSFAVVDTPVLVMAVIRSGVDFAAIDNQPVFFIILLIVPKNKFQTHISTLAEIAKLMNHSDFRQQLLGCPDTQAMAKLIHDRG